MNGWGTARCGLKANPLTRAAIISRETKRSSTMGVILHDTKKPTVTVEDMPLARVSSGPLGNPRGRRGRNALVVASAVASGALLAALALALLQAQQPKLAAAPSPLYSASPIAAVVNGHVMLRGASGWKDITPASFGKNDPVAAQFLSASLGWTVDIEVSATSTKDLVIYRTSDGGGAWKSVTLPWQDEGLANLVGVQFVDARHGYVTVGLGEATSRRPGFLFATSDGGATWTKLTVPYGGFTSPTDGWLVGGGVNYARNLFSVTHDGGHTWQEQPLVAPDGFELADRHIGTPAFTSARNGVLAVNYGTEVAFYTSRDGGATWLAGATFPVSQTPLTNREALPIVSMFGKDGWAMVAADLYVTHDGGATWSPAHHGANLTAVQWLGVGGVGRPTGGWAVVSHGGFCNAQLLTRCNNESLLATSDSGATWTAAM
jgi:hypothetical protein